MKQKKPFKHRFVKDSYVVDIKQSFGYYAYEEYKDWANRVGLMKGKIPLIGKAVNNATFLRIKVDSEFFKQYTQIPFLSSYDSPSAAPLKVVWVRYIKEVDLHYALVVSGVRYFAVSKDLPTEACVDLFIVPLKRLGLNVFSFEAPLYTSARCGTYYETDLSFLDNVGNIPTKVECDETKSVIEFLQEKPYTECCHYTYSMDMLNYLYSFIYRQAELPKDTLPVDEDSKSKGYINSAFVMCEDGLAEAIDGIWGNKITYPDYIDASNFIRYAYADYEECKDDSPSIEWTSFDDFMDNQWLIGPDEDDDFDDEE